MYAIVEIGGKQFRVAKDQNLRVPKINADNGSSVSFDRVLFFSDDAGKSQFGQPLVRDMTVSATVVEHGRDKKIIVFKKKRRKGYQVKNGHRQGYTLIKIEDISLAKKAATAKVQEEVKPVAEKKVAKKEKAAEKKPASKKATAKTKVAKPKASAEKKAAKPKTTKTVKAKKTTTPSEGKEA